MTADTRSLGLLLSRRHRPFLRRGTRGHERFGRDRRIFKRFRAGRIYRRSTSLGPALLAKAAPGTSNLHQHWRVGTDRCRFVRGGNEMHPAQPTRSRPRGEIALASRGRRSNLDVAGRKADYQPAATPADHSRVGVHTRHGPSIETHSRGFVSRRQRLDELDRCHLVAEGTFSWLSVLEYSDGDDGRKVRQARYAINPIR